MAAGIGLLACAISSLFFGSMFVPIKNFNAGDGLFVQWIMSLAILIVGFFAYVWSGFPGFYPLAMLGGVSWCLGNATAIPIISRLGMAISILVWNTTNCITGWAGGRFGLFGMKAQVPSSPLLNYLGLVCVVIGGILFSRVRSEPNSKRQKSSLRLDDVSSAEKAALNPDSAEKDSEEELEVHVKTTANSQQRIIGVVAALVAGVFYGMTFVPVIVMIDNPQRFPDHPTDGLSYVFSHYFGIFLTSTALFVVYSIIRRNKPMVAPELCLPSLGSGLLWAVAQTSFFVANQHLSQTVTFPIISMMPGCIASAWSIFYYKEIQGQRNFTILGSAMGVTMLGVFFVALSKAITL